MQEQLVALLPELEDDVLPARLALGGALAPGPAPRRTPGAASSRRRGGRRGGLVTLPPDSSEPLSNQEKFHDRASWLEALPAIMGGAEEPAVSVLDEEPTRVIGAPRAPRVIAVHVPARPRRRQSAVTRWILGAALLTLLFACAALLAYRLG